MERGFNRPGRLFSEAVQFHLQAADLLKKIIFFGIGLLLHVLTRENLTGLEWFNTRYFPAAEVASFLLM